MNEAVLLQDAQLLAQAQKDYTVGTFYYDQITGVNKVVTEPRWYSDNKIIIDGGIATSPIFTRKEQGSTEGTWARILQPEELTHAERTLWDR